MKQPENRRAEDATRLHPARRRRPFSLAALPVGRAREVGALQRRQHHAEFVRRMTLSAACLAADAVGHHCRSSTRDRNAGRCCCCCLMWLDWRAKWQVGLDLLWNLPSSSQRAADGQDPFACIYYC
jgi:hypothetical protein